MAAFASPISNVPSPAAIAAAAATADGYPPAPLQQAQPRPQKRGRTGIARRAGRALWQAVLVAAVAGGALLAARLLPPLHHGAPGGPLAAGRVLFNHSIPQSWRRKQRPI